jgi:hypothetical protein
MKTPMLLCAAATVLITSGCAIAPADELQASERGNPQYVTGSNIARHQPAGAGDGVTTLDREEVDRIHNSTPVGMPAKRPGAGG